MVRYTARFFGVYLFDLCYWPQSFASGTRLDLEVLPPASAFSRFSHSVRGICGIYADADSDDANLRPRILTNIWLEIPIAYVFKVFIKKRYLGWQWQSK